MKTKKINYSNASYINSRHRKIGVQHVWFMNANKTFISFREFLVFLDYLTERIISDSKENGSLKLISTYFQNWLDGDRDLYYHDARKMSVAEMKELYLTSILNDEFTSEVA